MIDNPANPAGSILCHSFVESPDMMNVYNGNAETDSEGRAVVELPSYFAALNRDFRYQLTPIGKFCNVIVGEEVRENKFVIFTDAPNVRVSWQVTGIRQDAWANANQHQVEIEKPESLHGKLLSPEAFGEDRESASFHELKRAADYEQRFFTGLDDVE